MHDVDRPSFWEERYRRADTPWDLGGPTPAFVHLLFSGDAPAPGRMLVPGCGAGHDALLFAAHGFEVTAVDVAPSALAAAARAAAARGFACTFLEADLLTLPSRFPEAFDYVLEYTCFCAINPARRPDYVAATADVLRPGGELLALFFPVAPAGYAPDGPPFAVAEEEIRTLFAGRFDVTHLAPTPHTIRPRRGRELFGRLRCR